MTYKCMMCKNETDEGSNICPDCVYRYSMREIVDIITGEKADEQQR